MSLPAEGKYRESTLRVMVLDANQRAALAVVRSLGRQGMEVYAADASPLTLAGSSRFVRASLVHPDMNENPADFLRWLEHALADHQIDALVPVTEISTDLVVRHRQRWSNVRIPFAPIETIDAISDKVALYRLALSCDVPVPESVVVSSDEDLEAAVRKIGFPCVLKPRRSRILVNGRWVSTTVRPVADEAELRAVVASDEGFHHRPFLYQTFIPGRGAGVFTLYRNGRPTAWFAHRRLREKPPGGGVSVLSESVAPCPSLVEQSRKLLDAASWDGVTMVEYRVDPEGRPWLMEVNARFWGSLQLAIDAGADFPMWLLADQPSLASIKGDARLHWVLGDVDRLWLVAKGARSGGNLLVGREALRLMASLLDLKTKSEVFRWQDPRPGWHELKHWCRAAITR